VRFSILADPSIPSLVPSDQGSPSSVAPELPVVSDTLPVIPSIQPINSRAPDDEAYEYYWNSIWEPSEDDIPNTPIGAPSPMSSSDMEDTSPIVSETPVVSNIDTPIPATSSVPSRYRSLRNAMGSRTPPSTTIWDHHITPTTGALFPPVHNTPVTSVPTEPTVCVAYSTPVVSAVTASSAMTPPAGTSHVSGGQPTHTPRVIHPAQSAPPSAGPVLVEGAYDRYLQTIQDTNAQGPFFYYDSTGQNLYLSSPLPPQPAVETLVPLSIAWGPTSYHGGQAIPAQPQGPPNQGQPLYV